ncbi:hypothetical protein ACOMHN_050905 [Nucella lapillus]
MEWLYTEDLDQLFSANLPPGALTGLHMTSTVEDQATAAEVAAVQGDDSAQPVKEGLRQRILLKRQRAGQPELEPDLPRPKTYELTPEEKVKKERRREQNRRAARRCREKKKYEETGIQKTYKATQKQNQQLHDQVSQLQQHERRLRAVLLTHLAACTLRLPHPLPPGQPVPQQRHQQGQQLQEELQEQQLQRQQQQPFLWREQPPQPSPQSEQLPQQHLPLLQAPEPQQLPHTPPPPVLRPEVEQHLHHQQQQQHQQLHLLQRQQQQQYSQQSHPAFSNLASPANTNTIPQTLTTTPACSSVGEADQPMLGFQGFDAICSQLRQNGDLFLDSQELEAVLGGGGAPSPLDSNAGRGVHYQGTDASPASLQAMNLPQYLNSASSPTSPCSPAAAQSRTMTPYLPSSSSLSSPASLLPSSVQGIQPVSLQVPLESRTPVSTTTPAAISHESDEAILDLPGFPFAMRKKRKSTDSCAPLAGKGKNGQAKMAKSATCPARVSAGGQGMFPFSENHLVSDSASAVTFTLGNVLASSSNKADRSGSSSTVTTPYQNVGRPERASPAPPSPLLTLPTNTPCLHRVYGYPALTPSPSSHSPCHFRFPSVTPPPRSPLTPQAPSPLTPPPSCSSVFPGGPACPPAGQNTGWEVLPYAHLRGVSGPPLLLPAEGSEDQDNPQGSMEEMLGTFLSSNNCEGHSECLSSCSLLGDGLMSSQED